MTPKMAARTRQQAGRHSKSKGNNQERKVAKLLQDWWNKDNKPEDRVVEFTRVPLSGGWNNREQFGTFGDIICSDPQFPFCVEVKKQEKLELAHLLTSSKPILLEWWDQCVRETPEGKIPLLVFCKNNLEELCAVEDWTGLQLRNSRSKPTPVISVFVSPEIQIMIFKFKDILSQFNKDQIIKLMWDATHDYD